MFMSGRRIIADMDIDAVAVAVIAVIGVRNRGDDMLMFRREKGGKMGQEGIWSFTAGSARDMMGCDTWTGKKDILG